MRSGVGVTGEFAHLRQSSTSAPGRVRALIDRVPFLQSLYGLAWSGASVFKLPPIPSPRNSGRKRKSGDEPGRRVLAIVPQEEPRNPGDSSPLSRVTPVR